MPNKDSRVCNLHFVDGEPVAENPDPTLQLGHNEREPPNAHHQHHGITLL